RGRRREPHTALGVVRDVDGRRGRATRAGDVSRLSPVDARLLRRLPRPARRRDPRLRARRRGERPGNAPVGKLALGVGGDALRAVRCEDTWENLWLQRSAAHPWCGMRNMAALIGSGVMDRYPALRIGTLEAGHGWLPF